MLRNHLPFVTFTLIFLLLANWHVFTTTLTGLSTQKEPYFKLENQGLTQYIRDKTGVEVEIFYIVNSDSLFGGMTGIPTKPIMTISKEMYDSFSKEELQYVLLHETGHYVLNHLMKELLIQVMILCITFLFFHSLKYSLPITTTFAVISAILLGIGVIQIMRSFERQADTYALQHLDNPQAMIGATKKLEAVFRGPSDDSMKRTLFYRGVPYSQRIHQAENYSE